MNDVAPLLGGALIGLAASLMLLGNGRVTGVSGILYRSAVAPTRGDLSWRWFFLGGMLGGGFVLRLVRPESFDGELTTPLWTVVVAGLLVGFGTVMGSGCTSGHGVCGISRLSPRSIVATLIFMLAGMLAVVAYRQVGILQ